MIMQELSPPHIRRTAQPGKDGLRIPISKAAMLPHRCQIEVQETRCDSLRVDVKAPFGLRRNPDVGVDHNLYQRVCQLRRRRRTALDSETARSIASSSDMSSPEPPMLSNSLRKRVV